jgi:hypothetical protein
MSDQPAFPVGFLVASCRGDFLFSVRSLRGAHHLRYVRWPGLAKRFRRPEQAARLLERVGGRGLAVVPLFDLGDSWGVDWPQGWDAAVQAADR